MTDKLDSVRDVDSSAGSVLDHVVYDSFGNITTETNASNGDRFKFAGMEYDATTDQYYDHARWYAPGLGHFAARDPLCFVAGDPNLYRYLRNSPTSSTDPTGRIDISDRLGNLLLMIGTGGVGIEQFLDLEQATLKSVRNDFLSDLPGYDPKALTDEDLHKWYFDMDDTLLSLEVLLENVRDAVETPAAGAAALRAAVSDFNVAGGRMVGMLNAEVLRVNFYSPKQLKLLKTLQKRAMNVQFLVRKTEQIANTPKIQRPKDPPGP